MRVRTWRDGNVLLLGGCVTNPQAIEQGAEIFDVNAATFTRIGLTAAARIQPTMTLRTDGVVQIFGGDAAKSTEFGSGTPEVSLGKSPRGLGKWNAVRLIAMAGTCRTTASEGTRTVVSTRRRGRRPERSGADRMSTQNREV